MYRYYTVSTGTTSMCGRTLNEACATIGDWVVIVSHIPSTVLLLKTVLLLEIIRYQGQEHTKINGLKPGDTSMP